MCFRKSNISNLVGFSRSFLPSILESIYAYKSLLLTLILNTSSHASYFKRDINITSLKGLIKAIFLFEGVKTRVFGCKLYKRRLTVFGY